MNDHCITLFEVIRDSLTIQNNMIAQCSYAVMTVSDSELIKISHDEVTILNQAFKL